MRQKTLCDTFFHGCEQSAQDDRFRRKRSGNWESVSIHQFKEMVRQISGALRAHGIGKGDRVALLSYNRIEWAASDYGILTAGATTVPLYSTLPSDQCDYILRDCAAKLIIVEDEEQYNKVAHLQETVRIVSITGTGGEKWETFLAKGADCTDEIHRKHADEVSENDLATFVYTSGTTGKPKGVMLTHRNLVSNILSTQDVLDMVEGDVALSFLPLSHIFERTLDYGLFFQGATIAYAEHIDKVAENVSEVRPTILAAVPRFYEKVYARIQESVAAMPNRRKKIFHWALRVGREESEYRIRNEKAPFWLRLKFNIASRLVFRKIHDRVGGRIKVFLSGGAPLAQKIAEFFFSAGFVVLEGYGLSETSPVLTVNYRGATRLGTVGKPVPGVDLKIADDGEILARGPNIMQGYYNMPEETREVLTEEGWFHTGDIGEFDSDGFLRITDRKKDLAKTSGGKYIAPQPIENQLKLHPAVLNAVIVADQRNFPSALLVPDMDFLRSHLQLTEKEEQLLLHPEVTNLYEEVLSSVNKALAPFEQPKKFRLLPKDFELSEGEITPTMKIRRRVIEKKYQKVIDEMYES